MQFKGTRYGYTEPWACVNKISRHGIRKQKLRVHYMRKNSVEKPLFIFVW